MFFPFKLLNVGFIVLSLKHASKIFVANRSRTDRNLPFLKPVFMYLIILILILSVFTKYSKI